MSLAPNSTKLRRARRLANAATTLAGKLNNPLLANMYAHAVREKAENDNPDFLRFIAQLREVPVDIETFLDSTDFLGATDLTLWPEVRKAIVELNSTWWLGGRTAYREYLGTAATGTGKSEIAKVTTAYHLHILACMKSPQTYYGLPSATSIVIPIQAAKPHVTKKVVYLPLRHYIETMPWFVRNCRFDKLVEAEMYFESINVRIVPGGADADAILGEACIAGVVDEINFMNVVEKSKRAGIAGGAGRSGAYDQAQTVYDALTRRKKSRFISRGPQIGVICIMSSCLYKNDFTDRRKRHVETSKEPGVYIYDKAQFEARPAHLYSGEKFRISVSNDASTDVRVHEDPEENAPRGAEVIEVPIEYLEEFKKDASGALRDIVGRSVASISPFFRQRAKITAAVELGRAQGLESFLLKDNVILGLEGMPLVKRGHYCMNPSVPRYVHIDLSNTGDRCGVAMCRFDGFLNKQRANGNVERLPRGSIEMAVTLEPDHVAEIDLAEVRAWVDMLRTVYGYPIKAVTYDGWNSLESRQAWVKKGMRSGTVSVDRTSAPYKQYRDAIYDGRLALIDNDILTTEMYSLEYDEKKDKIDHTPTGSKDCSDAACGAFYTMITRASSWQGAFQEAGIDPRMAHRYNDLDRYEEDRPE